MAEIPKATALVEAEKTKAEGNAAFKQGHTARALLAYSTAIDVLETPDGEDGESEVSASPEGQAFLKVVLCNRAFCHLKLENFGSAIMDATQAVEIDGRHMKAYYRRGSAYLCLSKFKEAKADFTKVCKLVPKDKDAREKLKQCQKELQAQAFAAAIQTESSTPLFERLDIDSMPVPAEYEGPQFSQPVTVCFLGELLAHQEAQKNLAKRSAYQICFAALQLLKEERSIVHVPVPPGGEFTVCGDVHGQYYDLINIFKINGAPAENNPYLFNGDFVDRGSFSMECILLLFAYKVAYPKHFYLSRGNHETKAMNKLYGFSGEVTAKFDECLYDLFSEAFCYLPLAHVIAKQVFVVHGGLFLHDEVSLDELAAIDRNREPPDQGLMVEMLWSDPQKVLGRAPSKRGVGVMFGPDVTKTFLDFNKLKMIVRSHEMKEQGYEVEHDGRLVTVFSAPNYCDQMGNKGAFIRFKADASGDLTPHYTSFDAVPHPPVGALQYANKALFGPMLGLGGMGGMGGGGGGMMGAMGGN